MKDIFPEYYIPTKEEFDQLWNKCIFVFDTNIILNLYRYSPKTRERFLEVLKKLSDRIWIPYQVAKEYQEQRLSLIVELEANHKKLKESFENRHSEISDELYKQLMREFDGRINEYNGLFENDVVRIIIDDLFKNKIGREYTAEELDEIYKKGEERYANKVPPGYEDAKDKKDNRKYGDLILWRQIIDTATSNKNNIIFTTDDAKEDWWNKCHGKTSGPRPELIKEFISETHMRFHMYSSTRFVEFAEEYLRLQKDKEAIEEIERIAKEGEKPKYPIIPGIKGLTYSYSAIERSDDEKVQAILDKTYPRLKEIPNITEDEANKILKEVGGDFADTHNIKIRLKRAKSLFEF